MGRLVCQSVMFLAHNSPNIYSAKTVPNLHFEHDYTIMPVLAPKTPALPFESAGVLIHQTCDGLLHNQGVAGDTGSATSRSSWWVDTITIRSISHFHQVLSTNQFAIRYRNYILFHILHNSAFIINNGLLYLLALCIVYLSTANDV